MLFSYGICLRNIVLTKYEGILSIPEAKKRPVIFYPVILLYPHADLERTYF